MADIRDTVETDRGVLKKMQAFLPGYKKYRNCEDLRAADNLLRQELAKKMDVVVDKIQTAREEIARGMDFDALNRIGEIVNKSQTMAEKIRHAQQGYAPWISGDVRIEEPELNKLYEYDLSLFDEVTKMQNQADELVAAARGSGESMPKINSIKDSMVEFERVFDARISKVTAVAQE